MISDVATGLVGGWRADVSDIDDGWAIAMAAHEPALNLLGVVVTFGNGLVDPEMIVAEHIVYDLLDRADLPVVRGAAEALSTEQTYWYDGTSIVSCAGSPNHDADDNLWAGHGPDQPASLDKEGTQLWLGNDSICERDDADCQSLATAFRGGTVCTTAAEDDAQAAFIDAIFSFLDRAR